MFFDMKKYIYIYQLYQIQFLLLGESAPLRGSVQEPKRHGQLLLAHLANFPIAGRAGWPKHIAVRTWLLLYQYLSDKIDHWREFCWKHWNSKLLNCLGSKKIKCRWFLKAVRWLRTLACGSLVPFLFSCEGCLLSCGWSSCSAWKVSNKSRVYLIRSLTRLLEEFDQPPSDPPHEVRNMPQPLPPRR